jgi:hypothetical protein
MLENCEITEEPYQDECISHLARIFAKPNVPNEILGTEYGLVYIPFFDRGILEYYSAIYEKLVSKERIRFIKDDTNYASSNSERMYCFYRAKFFDAMAFANGGFYGRFIFYNEISKIYVGIDHGDCSYLICNRHMAEDILMTEIATYKQKFQDDLSGLPDSPEKFYFQRMLHSAMSIL